MAICATVLAILFYPIISRLTSLEQGRKKFPTLILLPFGAVCGGVTCWLLLHPANNHGTTYFDASFLLVVLPIFTALPSAIILTALWRPSHAKGSIGVSNKTQTPREQIESLHHKHDII